MNKRTVTIEEIRAIMGLTKWLDLFKWQGGTIWQVKKEIERILAL